jgi:hypothetical protein
LTGLLFGAGIAATGALFGGWNWGGRGNSYVNVNVNRAVNIDNNFDRNRFANNNRWQHDPVHRKGVAYRDPATSQHFGQNRPGADQRQQFRGRLEGNPGGPIANRPQANARPNLPQANARPNLPQRPGGGQQHPNLPNRGGGNQGPRGGGALSGVNRGQQVNREAARGRAQQQRAVSHGGGGGRPGGGGGRPAGGGGRPAGGGGARGGHR